MGLPLGSPVAKLSCEAATEENAKRAELYAPDPSYRQGELLARNNILFARYTSDCSPESNHRRWSIAGRIVSESFTDTLEPARLPP